jgi:hypothetical protein
MTTATSTLVTNSPADTLNWQQEQIRDNKYELVGYIWKVVLEASRGAAVPQPQVARTLGTALEWYGYENYKGKNLLPRIAQTKDRSSLLLLDPVKRADGSVGLPDIPDPTWVPEAPTAEQLQTVVPLQKTRMIPQHLYEEDAGHNPIGRARGQLKGTRFLVFGPVVQILVRPVVGDKLIDEGWILQCGVNPGTGKHMELLIHQDTGQAFLYEGKFQIYRPG